MFVAAGSAITHDAAARISCMSCIQNATGTTQSWAMGQCVYNATVMQYLDTGIITALTGVQAQCYQRTG